MQILLTAHPRYKYMCGEKYELKQACLLHLTGHYELLDNKGRLLAEHKDGKTIIHKGYSIDGATCAPDFRRGMRGFFVHDLYLQFLDKYPGAFPEQLAHDAMREMHWVDNFKLAGLYYWAVSSWPRRAYVRVCKLLTKIRNKL